MSFPLLIARSAVTLPRARSVERGDVATLTRVASVPSLNCIHVGERYRPSTLFKYRRDYDLLDDYYHDRMFFDTPLHWQDYRFAARRYVNTDPFPRSFGFEYPAFWSRYKWYIDSLNPIYWRRYRDPNYDRPLWNKWQPWHWDGNNVKRAIRMFKNGLTDFATLDQFWIVPSALSRKEKDWTDVYLSAARYGPRRYFYSFA